MNLYWKGEGGSRSLPPLCFSHSPPQVRLHDGIILLDQDHTIASAGQKLTPEQAHVLRLLDVKMAESRISPKCVWYKGKFKAF